MATIVKSDLEQQIDDLGQWAAMLELSAHDATMPYWMRQKDAEHAKAIRIAIGSPYCARCEEEINGEPYPLANLFISETKRERIKRFIKGVFNGK